MAASTPANQPEILNACSTGAIDLLQEVLQSCGIEKDAAPLLPRDAAKIRFPSTEAMITAAIAGKQTSMISFLLSYFSGYPAEWPESRRQSQKPISFTSSIVLAVLDNPDVETLSVLCDYDPGIVNFEFNDHTTFLSQACQRDPEKIGPLIHFLVSHGADMQGGWRLDWNLLPAIRGGQHLDVVEAMVAKGAKMDYSAALAAVCAKRADVLQLILEKGGMRESSVADADIEQLRVEAQDAKSVPLIEVVETLVSARQSTSQRS
ncbi:hypothetical protein N0V93_004669 [Gnomoniopsis smithogilvyi]|uniref:Ankyrin n=1 Tax=Gnomoniopsis smithogilvyi TaxID=1191159 RepID=A0A9W9CXA3_9PEZI|nr:hypothetical protein N0V93_004669 [Gnomoniopsis smithogilvyi]